MAKTELTDLPNEVLVEIFKALDAKTKLSASGRIFLINKADTTCRRLMRVCKNFKANLEVPTLWTEFSSLDVTNAYYDEMAEFQNQTRKSKRKSKATIQKDFRTRHLRIAGFAKGNIKSLEMTPLAIPHPSLHKASTRVLGQIATSNCTNITEMTVGIVSCASWLRELLPKMVALRSLTVTQAAIDAEIGSLIERGEEYELPVNIKRLKVLVWGVNLRPWTIKGSLETLQVCSIHGSRRPYQVHLVSRLTRDML